MRAHLATDQKTEYSFNTGLITAGLLLILPTLILLSACSGGSADGKAAQPKVRPAVPVTVAKVLEKSVPMELTAIGTVEAYATINVKSQVSGELTRVHFKQGEEVTAGDILFTIDPRSFQAQLRQAQADRAKAVAQQHQAEANLARDAAQSRNAQEDVRRYDSIVHKGAVAKEAYDKVRTDAQAMQSTVDADRAAIENAKQAIQGVEAAIENAKLLLEYCTIRSPITGRTGNLLIDRGNLIKANDTPFLVVINQVSPIYVDFTLPEQYLPEVKQAMARGNLKVLASIPSDAGKPAEGKLTFLDNQVDRNTGMIHLKGTFTNKDRRLWPGQFVNTALTLKVLDKAVVVSSQAVQAGQNGQYAFVIKPDLTAESRPVTIGDAVGAELIVKDGLKPGEVVVTDGQLNLAPGTRVEVKQDQASGRGKSK